MEQLERRDKCSNSLLANVLDMDDDFLAGTGSDKVGFGNTFWREPSLTWLGLQTSTFWREQAKNKLLLIKN